MTIAYWCLLIAIFLPYAFTGFAKFQGGFGPRQNLAPREFMEGLEGGRKRAHWAQLNSFEVHPGFYAAVIVAQLVGGAEQGTIDALAVTFVVSRVLFGVAYIADKGSLRSLIWAVGMGCIIGLFVTAA